MNNIIKKNQLSSFLKRSYNINVKKIFKYKNGVQNNNYLISDENKNTVLRIYNYKKSEEILYTIKILEKLKKSNFPSPRLISNFANKPYSIIKGKPCILYQAISGSNMTTISLDLIKEIGSLHGKMHNQLILEKSSTKIISWDYEELINLIEIKKEKLLKLKFHDISTRVDYINKNLNKLSFPQHLPKGGTHQDIKPENIIVNNDKINGIIDFDNAYYGSLLHDLSTSIIWFCFNNGQLKLERLKTLVESYQKERKLQDIEKEFFSDSIKFRLLREAIIWPITVSHNIKIAKKLSDYFTALYINIDGRILNTYKLF